MLLTLWRKIPFWAVGRIQRKKVREFRNISEGEGEVLALSGPLGEDNTFSSLSHHGLAFRRVEMSTERAFHCSDN